MREILKRILDLSLDGPLSQIPEIATIVEEFLNGEFNPPNIQELIDKLKTKINLINYLIKDILYWQSKGSILNY